jgi:hypothetical protein
MKSYFTVITGHCFNPVGCRYERTLAKVVLAYKTEGAYGYVYEELRSTLDSLTDVEIYSERLVISYFFCQPN